MVVGIQEDLDVPAQVVMAGVAAALHGRFLERAVHAFDLAVIRHDVRGASLSLLLRCGAALW